MKTPVGYQALNPNPTGYRLQHIRHTAHRFASPSRVGAGTTRRNPEVYANDRLPGATWSHCTLTDDVEREHGTALDRLLLDFDLQGRIPRRFTEHGIGVLNRAEDTL